ncbi:aldose epimerase family protein [Pontivivens nitratireducens]|uniref:Galactose mutarotase n=1 Tax=Pontivivens nitratireducens TaxID=2758038 RepID=A0A6G7VMD4_9RHOB|nr:aldose epimerase family protein [Pontibrevibacter nitratireducens]QIK41253.1 galactose mutarotase [Pontibrevibacter nitratireducens]
MQVIGQVDGQDVYEHVLDSGAAQISVMSLGAAIRDWRIAGVDRAMVLGFPTLADHLAHARAHGTVAGRVANRTGFGRFSMNGEEYHLTVETPPHHLHGGPEGLGLSLWRMEANGPTALHLSHHSPDGHMGYPGAVDFTFEMTLTGTKLRMVMEGVPDRETPINLAQHNYYTLGAEGVRDLVFHAAAEAYTPTDETLLPYGRIDPVEGTQHDFRTPRSSRQADPDEKGIDTNLVLSEGRPFAVPCCVLRNPENGVTMQMWTDQPGLQIFNTWHFRFDAPHHDGLMTEGYQGFAVEPQHFPDSLNNPQWPSILYSPQRPYRQVLEVDIAKG